MKIILVANFVFLISAIYGYDSESSESNRIEVSPFYDTIIYSDIADIINDFENNGVSPFDWLDNSESKSDEAIENLLSEYQNYLDKAHKQRKSYMEKSKIKNKVPQLPHHDQFLKTKTGIDSNHDEYFYDNNFYNPGTYKIPPSSYGNPLEVFIPVNTKGNYVNKPETTTILPKGNHEKFVSFDKLIFNEKRNIDLPTMIHKSSFEPIKSSCYCKNGQIPCDCSCKQCLVHIEAMSRDPVEQTKLRLDDQKKTLVQHALPYDYSSKKNDHLFDETIKEADNMLNIRIKIDLQLPKLQEISGRYYKVNKRDGKFEPEEFTNGINLPFPYFNFPIPMELFGYKKGPRYFKDDSTPLHKITIHKKRKSKINNNNKKHRKKVITFHNIKLQQQSLYPNHVGENNGSETYKNDNDSNVKNTTLQPTNLLQFEMNSIINRTDDTVNETQTEESIYLMVNITNNAFNGTEDTHKNENSIESELSRKHSNMTTKLPFTTREKREVSFVNKTYSHHIHKDSLQVKDNITKEKKSGKKADKNLPSDVELLYWPNITRHKGEIKSKNITTIILENEHKKTKLNMSKDTIRQNHTKVLEQAIFGNVDWNDVDMVAPTFMSFVGKYIRGVLTFCSRKVCHSMNCANKTCLHRICLPSDRLNNKGHCAGTNSTDSVASMESIMDLPSNIAFEIVDILQNKMLGRLFGKATFCINAKCISLVASKKNFVKSRCSIKELSSAGHCSKILKP